MSPGDDRGSAIVIVLGFLIFVGIISLATSFQSSGLRRMQVQSAFRYFAMEIAESGINEAAGQVTLGDVFPSSTFGSELGGFFRAITNEDEAGLNPFCGGSPECSQWMNLLDVNGRPTGKRIWMAWTFPAGPSTRSFAIPLAEQIAGKVPGFLTMTDVEMTPLSFRRVVLPGALGDPGRWENFGVTQFQCAVTMKGAFGEFTHRLVVDRLFTIDFRCDAPTNPTRCAPRLILSDRNLKTIVKRDE